MANVSMRRKDSIVDEVEQWHRRIADRAYILFLGRNGWGDPISDWLSAERELLWRPAVELCERAGAFIVAVAMPGVDAKDIKIDITPRDIVIKAAIEHRHAEDEGYVHQCEFRSGEVFRSLSFPKSVRAEKATAEYQNGMLHITVPIVPAAASGEPKAPRRKAAARLKK